MILSFYGKGLYSGSMGFEWSKGRGGSRDADNMRKQTHRSITNIFCISESIAIDL